MTHVVPGEDPAGRVHRYGRCVRGFRHPYLWGRHHPLVVDVVIAVAVAAFGLLTELAGPVEEGMHGPTGFSVFLSLAGTLPLIWRRRYPMTVFAVCWAATVVHGVMRYPGAGALGGSGFALYAVATHARSRRVALATLGFTYVCLVSVLVIGDADEGIGDIVGIAAFLTAAWVLGDNMRIRRAYVTTVEERAERLELERDAQAQRAVLEERTRIARDLHDVVAHGMSVMVVQAGAARRTLAHDDTDRATEALRNIEATGRGALEEMRRLVGVLRAPATNGGDGSADGTGPPRLPQPGIGDVDDLVAHCREAGLDVTLRVEGDRRELPSGLELVVYRIAQEALTNTIRHAGPARAEVRLGYGTDCLELAVTDDGRGAATSPRAEPGHGLAGMRERVDLYGGTITVGPQRGGGFRVLARLPLDPASPGSAATPAPTASAAASAPAVPAARSAATP